MKGLLLSEYSYTLHTTKIYSITFRVAPATHSSACESNSYFPSLFLPELTTEIWIVWFFETSFASLQPPKSTEYLSQVNSHCCIFLLAFANWSPPVVILVWSPKSLLFWVVMEITAHACCLYADQSLDTFLLLICYLSPSFSCITLGTQFFFVTAILISTTMSIFLATNKPPLWPG